MEKKAEGQARKKALRMAVFILLALEAAALLARTVSEVGQYLRMDITNPAHHAIFAAVAQWNSFQDTLLLMTKEELFTLQFQLYQYINKANSLKALVNSNVSASSMQSILATSATATSIRMTVTVVVVLPVMMVYPFFQRFFTKGIMIGAVKG